MTRHVVLIVLVAWAAATCGGGGDGGTAPPTITSVTVSGDSTVALAGTTTLTASARSGTTPVTQGVTFQWTSSDQSLATVSQTGVVSGLARGMVTVTAQAVRDGQPTGISGQRSLRVRIEAVVITSPPPTFTSLGETATFGAEPRNAVGAVVTGVTITWESLEPSVASVNSSTGGVTALANGTARIVASATGENRADTVVATVQQVATSLDVVENTTSFDRIGATFTPTVAATDAGGSPVPPSGLTWTSRDLGVVTVNASGVITSVNDGSAYVVASSGAVKDSIRADVQQLPASVAISPQNLATPNVDMIRNQTAPFYATVRDANDFIIGGATVTWSTSDAGVAGVDAATGVVTTTSTTGSATITATASPASGTRVVNVVTTGVSYASSIRNVLNSSCTGIGCHSGSAPEEGLNLSSSVSYANLFDVASTQVATLKRVRAFRPDSSYLVHKLQGTQSSVGGTGVRMPRLASPLPNSTIDIIRNWILQGALNN